MDKLEILFYTVQDNKVFNGLTNIPAMTTLLHKVCDGDGEKFDEACRLIRLYMEAAYEKAKT